MIELSFDISNLDYLFQRIRSLKYLKLSQWGFKDTYDYTWRIYSLSGEYIVYLADI